MEVSKQIKKYRNEKGYSQDELSEKIFVSRQTISSWENGKSYPDIKSLLMLSNVFDISLDNLVKGDVEEMKKIIEVADVEKFKRDSNIFAVILLCLICVPAPLMMLRNPLGIVIYVILVILGLYYGYKLEKQKKELDIHTYKEIVAFTENRGLTESEKSEEKGKYIYQKIFIVGAVAIIAMVSAYASMYLLKTFM